MNRYLAALVFACALSLPAVAEEHGPQAADEGDTRCLVIGALAASSANPAAKSGGMLAAAYFIGRIDGRTPDANLLQAIQRQIKTFKPDQVAAEAKRCGALMAGRGEALAKIGQILKDESLTSRL